MYWVFRDGCGVKVDMHLRNVKWGIIQPKSFDNDLKDLIWLSAMNRLPVKDVLFRHGCAVNNKCKREGCNKEETIMHVFWECKFAKEFWGKALKIIKIFTGDLIIDGNSIVLGEKVDVIDKERFLPAWSLICMGKKMLWDKRNKCK